MTSPATLYETAWKHLLRAVNDKKHAFSTPSVSTVARSVDTPASSPTPRTRDRAPEQLAARSRRLVLRKAIREGDQLWCYTDRRSDKLTQLENSGGVLHWLFWDRKSSLQLSGGGPTRELDRAEAERRFDALEKHSRKAYATTLPPGTPLAEAGTGLPEQWEEMTREETDFARQNFTVLVTELTYVDVLHLDRAGHRRVKGVKTDGRWEFSWVVP